MFQGLTSKFTLLLRTKMTGLATSKAPAAGGRTVRLDVKPISALVDEPLHVRVAGLEPDQRVTIAASTEEKGCFLSHAHYTASSRGELDLDIASSDGGSFEGVEPMGLFWGMKPATGQRAGMRLMKRDVSTPLDVELQVLPGTVTVRGKEDIAQAGSLAQCQVHRWYMGHGVRRVVVREGRLRGALFLPPGIGPFPAVIDLFGTAGGLIEYRAALLASRGVAALALAYFNYDDLPAGITLDLDYFDEAIEWLHEYPDVLKTGVGVVGISKGAELVLHMAAFNPKVRAAVSINSYHFYSSAVETFRGEEHPTFLPGMSDVEVNEEGLKCGRAYQKPDDEIADCIIPVERIDCPVLLLHGEDDQQCLPYNGTKIAERMRAHGNSNYRLMIFPGAGHLIEPPHSPVCRATFHKFIGVTVIYGGDAKLHAKAQEVAWADMLEFLKSNLAALPERAESSKVILRSSVTLHASPASALVDDLLDVYITGLQPDQNVTLTASLKERGSFLAHAHYTADHKGEVHLNVDPSRGGSYEGVEPMGLFWSMKPATGQRPGTRLMKRDVTTPLDVELQVLPGTVTVRGKEDIGQTAGLAQCQVHRWYMGHGVRRVVVREGRLRGALFLPPGDGPFPGVIDLFGTVGGLIEFRAALLASRGYATVALAYFAYEDLPSEMNLDLDYFDEAIEWLHSHPKVLKTGVGVIGVSKGAELALHMAAHNSKVKATVAINSYHYYATATHTFRGKEQSTVKPNLEKIMFTDAGVDMSRCYWEVQPAAARCLIPVENIATPVLLMQGEVDKLCVAQNLTSIVERMQAYGRTNYEPRLYPKAGHLIEPPHSPLATAAWHKLLGDVLLYGGEAKPHARAQEESWSEILSFFRTHLQARVQQSHSKL